jgi:sugar/nucleoside kinase (ribokinase family)
MRVVVAGHVCADLAPELPREPSREPGSLTEVGPLTLTAGGAVSNTAAALVAMGDEAIADALVGDDSLGVLLGAALAAVGISPSGIRAMTGTVLTTPGTAYSIVLEPGGVNRRFWHYPGANTGYLGENIDFTDVEALHVGYPPLLESLLAGAAERLVALLEEAHEAGAVTSIDMVVVDAKSRASNFDWVGLHQAFLPHTDIFSPSVDDMISVLGSSVTSPEAAADLALRWGAAVAVVSAGPDGLVLRSGSVERLAKTGGPLAAQAEAWADAAIHYPAVRPRRIVSTNGAGDALSAGLLHAIGCGLRPQQAAMFASRAAAAKIAGDPLPTI